MHLLCCVCQVRALVQWWEAAHASSPLHVTVLEQPLEALSADPSHIGTYDYVDNRYKHGPSISRMKALTYGNRHAHT